MVRRLTIATLLAGGIAFALLAAPASAQYQPGESQVLGSSTAAPGDTVTVSGTGCPAGSAVSTAFDGTNVASSTADASGNFSTSFTVPANASPGQHTVTSTCGSVVLTSTITVTGGSGGGSTASGSLPRTGPGFPVGTLLQVGIGLVAVGGVIYALNRSRLRPAS